MRRPVAALALAIAALGALTPAAVAAVPNGCPKPATCSLYRLERYRWPVSNGIATVSFEINPIQPWVSPDDAVAATTAAAKAWATAHSAIRVDYRGTSNDLPTMGDGRNTIGWLPRESGTLAVANIWAVKGKVVEADIVLNALLPWTWSPCAARNGACTNAPALGGALARFEIQAVLTHEFGHWLGLGHVAGDGATELTMFTTPRPGERKQSTLARGDVLGIRAAYPCRRCSMPAIVAP